MIRLSCSPARALRAAALALAIMAPVALRAESVKVASIIVVGAQRISADYVRSALPFRVGSEYESEQRLRRAAEAAGKRLEGNLGYYAVDISWTPPEDGSVDVSVGVIESVMAFRNSGGQSFSMFESIPLRGLSGGFAVDGSTQSLALEPEGLWPFGCLFTASSRFLSSDRFGLSGGVALSVRPIPELSVGLPIRYTRVFASGAEPKADDLGGGAELLLDLSWLERQIGIGMSLNLRAEEDLLAFGWTGLAGAFEATARPWRHLSVRLGGSTTQIIGDYPSWRMPRLCGPEGLRGASDDDRTPLSGMTRAGLDLRLMDAISLDLGFIRLGIRPELFIDVGDYVSEPLELDWSQARKIAGGGFELRFPPPVAMTFILLGGIDLSTRDAGFTFAVTSR